MKKRKRNKLWSCCHRKAVNILIIIIKRIKSCLLRVSSNSNSKKVRGERERILRLEWFRN